MSSANWAPPKSRSPSATVSSLRIHTIHDAQIKIPHEHVQHHPPTYFAANAGGCALNCESSSTQLFRNSQALLRWPKASNERSHWQARTVKGVGKRSLHSNRMWKKKSCQSELVCSWRRARRDSAVNDPAYDRKSVWLDSRPATSCHQSNDLSPWTDLYPPHLGRRRSESPRQLFPKESQNLLSQVSTHRPHDRNFRVGIQCPYNDVRNCGMSCVHYRQRICAACHVR